MAELDSMRRMWDALHHAGCEPHGDTYKFRARCPVHGGTNTDALQVYEGADRSCVFGCYAHGCDKRQILDAVGLRWRDMFPTGHRNGRRETPRRPVEPRPLSAGAAFLDTLLRAGAPWRAMVVLPCCPYCDNSRCLVWVHEGGGLDVECPDECLPSEVRRAVETRAAIAEATTERRAA
jgi:hypothetical protein